VPFAAIACSNGESWITMPYPQVLVRRWRSVMAGEPARCRRAQPLDRST
jgi:hypothetical protein